MQALQLCLFTEMQCRLDSGRFQRAATKRVYIDVLVDFKEGADLYDLVGLALFLEETLKRPVEVVPTDNIKSDIRDTILKEAIYI
jgi:hypothetical protein